ncbi:hypothetical protein U1Q18_029466 [Sarracenia purpurea var. burkii]
MGKIGLDQFGIGMIRDIVASIFPTVPLIKVWELPPSSLTYSVVDAISNLLNNSVILSINIQLLSKNKKANVLLQLLHSLIYLPDMKPPCTDSASLVDFGNNKKNQIEG